MKVIRHRLNLPPEYVISCLLERNTPNSVVIDNVQYSIKKVSGLSHFLDFGAIIVVLKCLDLMLPMVSIHIISHPLFQ